MMDFLDVMLLVTTAVILFGGQHLFVDWRAKKILRTWADKAGLHITTVAREKFERPDYWIVGRAQVVLRFTGVEKDGGQVRGWALCGDEATGVLFNDELEIKFT